MISSFRLIATTVMLLAFTSCKNNTTSIEIKPKTYSLTIQLPLESSNYYDTDTADNINFVLKDIAGKKCISSLDTITKGGGTVVYDSLITGDYTYSVNTIFDETITKTFHFNSDATIDLSPERIYGYTETITLDSLATTDSINIILSDTALSNTIAIKKYKNKYIVNFPGSKKKEQQQPIIKDSAGMMKVLIDMETALVGLQAMQVSNERFSFRYTPETGFYMKTGYEYMTCTEVDQGYFNAIHRKFIKAIFEK